MGSLSQISCNYEDFDLYSLLFYFRDPERAGLVWNEVNVMKKL